MRKKYMIKKMTAQNFMSDEFRVMAAVTQVTHTDHGFQDVNFVLIFNMLSCDFSFEDIANDAERWGIKRLIDGEQAFSLLRKWEKVWLIMDEATCLLFSVKYNDIIEAVRDQTGMDKIMSTLDKYADGRFKLLNPNGGGMARNGNMR